MARTTNTDLHATLEVLERVSRVERLGIAHANGRHCLVQDDGARDISPWLTTGELQEWMRAAIRGIRLFTEDGQRGT